MARAIGLRPEPPSAFWIRSRGTHAWTTPEIAKPSTSAHQTSQAIRNASLNPLPTTSSTPSMLAMIPPPGSGTIQRMATTQASPAGKGYQSSKDELLARLARVKGQVGGVERMVEQDRYCIDILTQISAIQAALDKVALGLLDGHARTCVVGARRGQQEARTVEMMAAVGRLMRRG